MDTNDYDERDKPWRSCQHGNVEWREQEILEFSPDEYIKISVDEVCNDCEKRRDIIVAYRLDSEVIVKIGDWEDE